MSTVDTSQNVPGGVKRLINYDAEDNGYTLNVWHMLQKRKKRKMEKMEKMSGKGKGGKGGKYQEEKWKVTGGTSSTKMQTRKAIETSDAPEEELEEGKRKEEVYILEAQNQEKVVAETTDLAFSRLLTSARKQQHQPPQVGCTV
ncbi:hypothetical protein BOTCAL_0121g00060 [Botryotinia calthae]|uniref:Uncharacterized protein n=1 Tax=Botryotinia calthae TaxID=38488 RepID=A0A4Y8D4Y4_9HELO|nr:hypothetical protein BOTCAL_0121g00060 [Botryotinia calthae]